MNLTKNKLNNLSRVFSHALRHEPGLYNLELDNEGGAFIDELIASLNIFKKYHGTITLNDIIYLLNNSSKKRHEINGNKIRALYGHSLQKKILKTPSPPPEYLFHGTSPQHIEQIKNSGLLPMRRQYVHLSTNQEIALEVRKRKCRKPVLLKIDALKAHLENIIFYNGNEHIWLADAIPFNYIHIMWAP